MSDMIETVVQLQAGSVDGLKAHTLIDEAIGHEEDKCTRKDGTNMCYANAKRRDRYHIDETLELNKSDSTKGKDSQADAALLELSRLYYEVVRPAESLYNYKALDIPLVNRGEIGAKPMVLFVGPWSVGKSSTINYLLDIENNKRTLHTGAEPTTSDFTVLMEGKTYKNIEGIVLATDDSKSFRNLERFGKGFLEKLQGFEMPNKLLEKITVVDTPGIIENRKQQERGYPFNEVMNWFIEHSDLIFVVFDPTKLDVGSELETLFKLLKGKESQIRIILNKSDSLAAQELMRVYGALFWSLAPLINVTEPPRVYIGSFWGKPYRQHTYKSLFHREEVSLLQDLNEMIKNRVENKISFVRRHAIQVKIHSLLVDQFYKVFFDKQSIFLDNQGLWADIVENPNKYQIYQSVVAEGGISKYDMPDPNLYKDFFAVNDIRSFSPLKSHCTFFHGCALD